MPKSGFDFELMRRPLHKMYFGRKIGYIFLIDGLGRMELESNHALAELLEPLSGLLGAMLLVSKTIAFVVFAALGGNVDTPSSARTLDGPILVDLSTAFYTTEDRFEPTQPIRFDIVNRDEYLPAISMQLGPLDIVSFSKFTNRHVGDSISLEVCGKAILTAILQEKILTGKLQLTGIDTFDLLVGYLEKGCP